MDRIKVYGERNTGTKYLEWLVYKNLNIEPENGFDLGWKHRLIPNDANQFKKHSETVVFLCLVKNPYSWLVSMHKRPIKHMMLRKTHFRDFISLSFGDYINPIEIWNKKSKSLIQLGELVKYHKLIKYEDLLADPESKITNIAEEYGFAMPYFFKNIKSILTHDDHFSKHKFHSDYYLEEKWKNKLSGKEIEIINKSLDLDLMKQLNYEIL